MVVVLMVTMCEWPRRMNSGGSSAVVGAAAACIKFELVLGQLRVARLERNVAFQARHVPVPLLHLSNESKAKRRDRHQGHVVSERV